MKLVASAMLFAAAVGVLVVASAPARLLDTMLDHLSHGQYRLALATGTIWHGQARLATADSSAALHPVSDLSWRLDPVALLEARLRWSVMIDGNGPATLEIHPGGIRLQRLTLQLPPAVALVAVPHAIARAGWRGVLALRVPALACAWSGPCEGNMHAEWRAGGVDILPGQALGDHRIDATLATAATTLQIHAIKTQAIAVNGRITVEYGRRPRLDLEIGGDAQLLSRLRDMLDGVGIVQDGTLLRLRS